MTDRSDSSPNKVRQTEQRAGGDQYPAVRTALAAAVTPGAAPLQPPSPMTSGKVIKPVQKPFPEEEKRPDSLVAEKSAESSSEGQLEVVFSRSVPVVNADANGAVVLNRDWRVETLDNGTRFLFMLQDKLVVLRKVEILLHEAGGALV